MLSLSARQATEVSRNSKTRRCRQCVTRKKKCDLRNPRCGRCSRVGLKCSFEEGAFNQTTYDQLQISPLDDLVAMPDSFPICSGLALDDNAIFRLAASVCDDISSNISPYIEGFNKWLPVIDGPALIARSQDDNSLRDPAFSTLLVACVLLSKVSKPKANANVFLRNQELYLTLIVSLSSLISRGIINLDILQAKILLALYEHLQANYIAAVGTLGSAASIAKMMGYFRWQCQTGPGITSMDNEISRVTCCLYILERLIHIIYHDSHAGPVAFSCPRPCRNRTLFDERGRLIRLTFTSANSCESCDCNQMGVQSHAPNTSPPSLLSRLLQASLLLEMSLCCFSDSSVSNSSEMARRTRALEGELNALASSLLEDRDQGAEVNCSILGLCINCTLIIHNRVGAPDPDPNLATVIRMVFDRLSIVPTFQYKFSRIISLWELHCFYLTARTYLPLHEYLSPLVGGNADLALNTILRTFKDYSTGWMIADELFSKIQRLRAAQQYEIR